MSNKKPHWGVQCPNCKERLFSWHVHDFHYCKCKDTFIDGGFEYLRFGYKAVPKRIKENANDRRIAVAANQIS